MKHMKNTEINTHTHKGAALQGAERRREVKGKEEKERCTHLNAEFQRKQGEIRKPFSAISAKK